MLLFEIFQDVPDPRTPHPWLKHSLLDVLCIGLCAVVDGGEGLVDMEDYGMSKEEWLRQRLRLSLPHGIPSHDIRPKGTRTACSRL